MFLRNKNKSNGFINTKGNEKMYEIIMPNGKKIKLWFIGKQLEEILKAYHIPYWIVKR